VAVFFAGGKERPKKLLCHPAKKANRAGDCSVHQKMAPKQDLEIWNLEFGIWNF
jgi:hypothetical protein